MENFSLLNFASTDQISSVIDKAEAYFLLPALVTLAVAILFSPPVQVWLCRVFVSPELRYLIILLLLFVLIYLINRWVITNLDENTFLIAASPQIRDFCLPPAT